MTLTLEYFFYFANVRGHKVLAAAAVGDVDVKQRMIRFPTDDDFKMNCSPLGGSPVLETPEGYLFESNAILRFVGRSATNGANLVGKSTFETGLVDAWLDLCATELDPLMIHLGSNAFFGKPLPEDFLESTELVFAGIEKRLAVRKYLVGDSMTVADVGLAFALQPFFRQYDAAELLAEKYPSCYKFYVDIQSTPKIAEVIKSVGGAIGIPSTEEKAQLAATAKAMGDGFLAAKAHADEAKKSE